jgi:hypothetical protein
MKGLSRVVQGRLHPDNDEEREALEVLEQWENAGHSTRQVITQALRVLGKYDVVEPDAVTAIRHMMSDMQESMVDAVVKLLEDRIEDLASMAPAERRAQVQSAARSTFGRSIMNAVDVTDYEGGE